MCRCPDDRPFWFETEDSDGGPKGQCVNDCDAAAAALQSDTSSNLTWLIILIIVLAVISFIIIYCSYRLVLRGRQKAKKREAALTSPPAYHNKVSQQSPRLNNNNIYEVDDDAIYAEEGDIQYSEGNDQRYDYDHYLAPDSTLPPSALAPELPDAPIPSELPQYINKPNDVKETENIDTPDILDNLAVNFKDKDSVYENN